MQSTDMTFLRFAVAGVGTLYTYSKMVALLGSARASVLPALAPGIAALLAKPLLDHVPTEIELLGLFVSIVGLIWTVTGAPVESRLAPATITSITLLTPSK